MSLFQSALDFLAGPGSLGAASRDQNDFVGQTVEMGEMKLRIKRVIAEGESGRQGRAGPCGADPGAAGLGWASPRASRSPFPRLLFLDREGFLLGRPRPGGGGRGGGSGLSGRAGGVRAAPRRASVAGTGGRCPQARSEQCLVLLSRLRNSRPRAAVLCGRFFACFVV